MLSAFTARPIVELKQRDKSRIECILAYGDRLLVGLNTGSLRIYRVNEPDNDTNVVEDRPTSAGSSSQPVSKQKPVDLLREEEKFSKRPIVQLAIVKEATILLSLSDSYVSIHDLHSYALQERLERTRGATSFAVTSNIFKDPASEVPSIVSRLAVAVKRKIILWSWQDMELSEEVTEISLIASVKSMTWASGTKIVAGMDPGFVLVDVETKEIKDIVKPSSLGEEGGQGSTRFGNVGTTGMGYMGMGSWVPKPMATRLSEGEMLLAKDVNSLFINEDGQSLEKRQVPWASAPDALGYSYPYLLTLLPPAKGTLEVRNPDTLSLLQNINLPNAAFLHVPQPNISLAHAGKGFLVGSDRAVWRMGGVSYNAQIDELIASSRFDEGISLLNLLEETLLDDKVGQLRQIKILKAQNLFQQRKYRDALDLFSEAKAPPASIISMYPKSIAADLSVVEPPEDGSAKESTKGASPPSTPQGSLTKAMISRFLAEKKDSDAASVKSSKAGNTDSPSAIKGTDKPLEGKDFTLAVNELNSFLVQTRTQLQKFLNKNGSLKEPLPPDSHDKGFRPPFEYYIDLPGTTEDINWGQKLLEVASLVDTTLFRGYMLVRPALAGPLFRVDNFCDPNVVNDKLYESGRYADLIDFLHGKRLHKQALELLAKFGKSEKPDEKAPQLHGPEKTVGYLQQLPPELIDLILEYSEWPLRSQPELGLSIFVADTENAETLPRHKVVDFLKNIDNKLAIRYLEHIVNELNDMTPDFHQRLIDFYLERLKANEGEFEDNDQRDDCLHHLEDFLRKSTQYNRARVFAKLPADEPIFYECRAIVLSHMGQHKQALQIYVYQIKDYVKAEEYCNTVYLATQTTTSSVPTPFLPPTDAPEDSSPSIYHTLLSLYLTPPPPHQQNWPPALTLLSKHGARLPASSTLSLIPSELHVSELESYFRGRIRSAVSAMREEAIVARLRGVEKQDIDEKLLLKERNRRVTVTEERVCGVCHKRFGGSAVRVYPDNTVVHYGCLRRRGGSTGAVPLARAVSRRDRGN